MKFTRAFTQAGISPYSLFQYEIRKSGQRNNSDSAKNVGTEVPIGWSQTASDILSQKYLRRKEVPQLDATGKPLLDEKGKTVLGGETSVRQAVDRLAGCWRHWGEQLGYFDTPEDGSAFYDDIAYMLLDQSCAPNSPQWFNTGLHWKYGITGNAQGHYYVDPKDEALKTSPDAFSRPQPHACFIQSVDDELLGENGIYSLMQREGRIFKYGSGTGTNFSAIRSSGENLQGGGSSSGLMSFLQVYDRAAGAIKSGGTTRRAAKMVCLDLDHPEIEEFIRWKSREESKVAALVAGSHALHEVIQSIFKLGDPNKHEEKEKNQLLDILRKGLANNIPEGLMRKALELAAQGITNYDTEILDIHFEGAAYTTVSGQNSNNSVRVPHRFMLALQEDNDWNLINRTDGKVQKKLKARYLWDTIAEAAWDCADPGVQFEDTINEWNTCPNDGRIRASNPCSEYMFLDDTACNLASFNLVKFQDENGNLKIKEFEHAVRLWTTVLEISVAMAQFPSPAIAQKSYDYRTLGLGYANLGSFLMRAGIAYESDKAQAITAGITAILCGISYATSAEMASQLGAFNRYAANREAMLKVMRNHRRAAYSEEFHAYENLTVAPKGIDKQLCPKDLLLAARQAWDKALDLGTQYGYRNAQVTVLAPTGTIGLLMDCDTTGIEPDYALVKFKKLVGGGYFKIVNRSVPMALKQLGYPDDKIRQIKNYCLGSGKLENAPVINSKALRQKGFNEDKIRAIENHLPHCLTLPDAFQAYTLGAEFLTSLGLSLQTQEAGGEAILHSLGFTSEEIEAADIAVCGAQTLEGAPYLKLEHYAVFDCANPVGAGRGSRCISALGHLQMMASAQAFLSGAISKTVNLPREATIMEIQNIYTSAWKMMIKAVALYRDACKLSQPLNSKMPETDLISQAKKSLPSPAREFSLAMSPEDLTRQIQTLSRRRLPTKRGGFVQEVTVSGHKLFLRTGEYPDGTLGEIFIDMYKEGAAYRGILNCFAVLTSKALQYGVPLEELVETFTFTRFEPAGPVEGHDNIKNCTSLLDLIFRVLGLNYLGKTDFVHIKPTITAPTPTSPTSPVTSIPSSQYSSVPSGGSGALALGAAQAKSAGYTGESCSSCGSIRVKRNGTCIVCEDCGTTSGCS